MTEKEIKEVTDLCTAIDTTYQEFKDNTAKPTNKAAAKRARKNTMELGKLIKKYREISIK